MNCLNKLTHTFSLFVLALSWFSGRINWFRSCFITILLYHARYRQANHGFLHSPPLLVNSRSSSSTSLHDSQHLPEIFTAWSSLHYPVSRCQGGYSPSWELRFLTQRLPPVVWRSLAYFLMLMQSHDGVTLIGVILWPGPMSSHLHLLPIPEKCPMYLSCFFTVRAASLHILSLLKIFHQSIPQYSCDSCPTTSQFFKQHSSCITEALGSPVCFPGCMCLWTFTWGLSLLLYFIIP